MEIIGEEVIGSKTQALSTQELELLVSLADGLTPSQIVKKLNTDTITMAKHEAQIKAKLGAKSKPHMISRAFILGVLMPRSLCFLLAFLTAISGPDDSMRTRRPSQTRSTRTASRIIRTGRTGAGRKYT